MLGDGFADVLAGALTGDERAFARLYRDAHPPLIRYLRVMSSDLAEDSAAEAWLEVSRGLDRFTGPEPAFRAWLFAIARRKVIDRIRYESRRPSSSWESLESIAPVQRDTAEEVLEADATSRALELVRTLPRDQAEAILLHVVAGLDYTDVAQLMARSTGAVRVLVHRGLRRLERDLDHAQGRL